MKEYLKTYRILIKNIGPVFIGNGKEISKKEYLFLDRCTVGIVDTEKLYLALKKKGKVREFEEYILNNNRDDLSSWFRKQNIKIQEMKPYIKYSLECGDAIEENGKRLQVMECIKDAYGAPYIPGSSLKGMLRTILLGEDIISNQEKYTNLKDQITLKSFEKNVGKISRTGFLKNEAERVETIKYRTLHREDTKSPDAVNDIMQGFIVSDSEPLSVDDLVLCQKIELHPDGREMSLPILRECIRPETVICFNVTIDTNVCSITKEQLMNAVKVFVTMYHNSFAKKFPGLDRLRTNCCFLGGGAGFVSKTMIYPLYGKEKGIEVSKNVFTKTGVPRVHKHEKDSFFGVSPHIMKCTRYQGKTLQMGLCGIKICDL